MSLSKIHPIGVLKPKHTLKDKNVAVDIMNRFNTLRTLRFTQHVDFKYARMEANSLPVNQLRTCAIKKHFKELTGMDAETVIGLLTKHVNDPLDYAMLLHVAIELANMNGNPNEKDVKTTILDPNRDKYSLKKTTGQGCSVFSQMTMKVTAFLALLKTGEGDLLVVSLVMLGISILFTFILGVMLVAIAKGVGRQEYFNSVIAVVSGLLTTWDVLVAGMGIKVAAT